MKCHFPAVSTFFSRVIAVLVAVLFVSVQIQAQDVAASDGDPAGPVFELRTYHTNDGKLDALHARFRDHTVGLFAKHGMTNVGYWVPQDGDGETLTYLLSYPSREDRDKMWKAFLNDADWKAAYAASTADGKLVKKVDSVLLQPTAWSPQVKTATEDPARLFELRQYTTNEDKLDDLHARFRDHTIALFGKHGMTNLWYFEVLPEQKKGTPPSATTLIYFLAHADQASRDGSFAGFGKDPDWQAARKASEANGKLLIKGGVQSTLLLPTDYSPFK